MLHPVATLLADYILQRIEMFTLICPIFRTSKNTANIFIAKPKVVVQQQKILFQQWISQEISVKISEGKSKIVTKVFRKGF